MRLFICWRPLSALGAVLQFMHDCTLESRLDGVPYWLLTYPDLEVTQGAPCVAPSHFFPPGFPVRGSFDRRGLFCLTLENENQGGGEPMREAA